MDLTYRSFWVPIVRTFLRGCFAENVKCQKWEAVFEMVWNRHRLILFQSQAERHFYLRKQKTFELQRKRDILFKKSWKILTCTSKCFLQMLNLEIMYLRWGGTFEWAIVVTIRTNKSSLSLSSMQYLKCASGGGGGGKPSWRFKPLIWKAIALEIHLASFNF